MQRIRPILIGVPLVFAVWVGSMLTVTLFASAGVPVAVVSRSGAPGALAAVLAADGDILEVRGDAVIAISNHAGFVARLYRAGALAVVQAQGGCGFALSTTPREATSVPAI